MSRARLAASAVVFGLIAGAIYYLEQSKPAGVSPDELAKAELEVRAPAGPAERAADSTNASNRIAAKARRYERAKDLVRPSGFINRGPFSLQDEVGKKVILVDFWTYSCINCQRTLPYLNAWWERYRDQGLVIVGVHTPEFEFEKEYGNVRAAVEKFGVRYPVALDNDYATWSAYQNRYWPRKYLIDIDGFIVFDHIGEGGYDQTERKIQELLAERATVLGVKTPIASGVSEPKGAIGVDTSHPLSPETYFGSLRNEFLGNGLPFIPGAKTFAAPERIARDTLYLTGQWDIQSQFAQSRAQGAAIIFRYRASRVYVVAGADAPVRVRVLRDGKPVGPAAGTDATDGVAIVKDERLYRLIEDPGGYGEHTLELEIEGPGLRAYTFTFG